MEDDAVQCLRAGCCDMRNLSASLAQPLTSFRKATIDGPIAPQADITMGVKIVLLPASLSSLWTNALAAAH